MPRVKLTDAQTAEFKNELVAVATRLFAEYGYAGVTMRAVAKELNCSPMKAYRYVGDKEELFAMVRTTAFRAFGESQKTAYFSSDELIERMRNLGKAYYRYAFANPLQYRLMFELFQPDPTGYPELQAAEADAMKPLRTGVAELVERGIFKGDVDLLTHAMWSGVHGVVSLSLAGKTVKSVAPGVIEEMVANAMFNGLAAG